MRGELIMDPWITGHITRLCRLATIVVGAALSFNICSTADAQDLSSPVRGAHEGMAADERTDDLGITVPLAPVHHPGRRYPATHEFATGPEVGERLPKFTLPNQRGETVDFHQNRGDSKAIVVFFRSVVW